jgi:hypothetical protein
MPSAAENRYQSVTDPLHQSGVHPGHFALIAAMAFARRSSVVGVGTGAFAVAVGAFFGWPTLTHPRMIGGEPLALQSAQNDFMVRLKASA